jgi:predicted phosphodiesterase
MRVAVISDIHANLVALEAVLAAVERESPDVVWCLGDTVGYGPRPNECCDLVRERASLCLVGNHDLAALDRVPLADFNDDAQKAARWTAGELTAESRAWLEGLHPQDEAEHVQLFHASPRDPVWEYVLTLDGAAEALEATTAPVVLVGHSHVAFALSEAPGAHDVEGGAAGAGTTRMLGDDRWLLNPGSVGQPRDGDPRAAFLVLDLDEMFAAFHRVEYSIGETQREIRARGLPDSLAARLAFGQ